MDCLLKLLDLFELKNMNILKMKKWVLVFLMVIITLSCGQSLVDKPDNLIDDDTMVEIFYDLAIIDASKYSVYENGVSTFEANDYILKKYKIDSLQFVKSNKYWAADVSKYKRMFKTVKEKLSDKKIALEKITNHIQSKQK